MKKLLFFLVIIGQSVFGQVYRDTVFLKNGTVIPCFIKSVNDTTNRVTFSRERSSGVGKGDVDYFIWNGKRYSGQTDWNTLKCEEWPFIQSLFPYHFEDIVHIENTSVDQLYSAVTIWAAESFKDVKEATMLNDPVNHVLIVKGNRRVCLKGIWEADYCYYRIHFTLKVMCKEGRFKFEISDINITGEDRYYGNWNYDVDILKPDNYFSRQPRKRGMASSTAYSVCEAINDLGLFISTALFSSTSSQIEESDW